MITRKIYDLKSILKEARKINVLLDLKNYKTVNHRYPAKCLKCNFDWYPQLKTVIYGKSACPKCTGKIVVLRKKEIQIEKEKLQLEKKLESFSCIKNVKIIKKDLERNLWKMKCVKTGKTFYLTIN